MKNLKNILMIGGLAGSLILGGCGNNKEENQVAQKEDNKIEEEKELYKFLNEGEISPNNLSADAQYCILPCQLDSANKNNDLVVFEINTERAKKLTDTPEINENSLCIFDDYAAFFGEFKRGNLHLRNVYIANYKTGKITELASYNYETIKNKHLSFEDGGKTIKLVDSPPEYVHENPLYKN